MDNRGADDREIIGIKDTGAGVSDWSRPVHAKSGAAIPVVGVQQAPRGSRYSCALGYRTLDCRARLNVFLNGSLDLVRYDRRRVRHIADVVGGFVDADENHSLAVEIR